jgi:hypothetical protein
MDNLDLDRLLAVPTHRSEQGPYLDRFGRLVVDGEVRTDSADGSPHSLISPKPADRAATAVLASLGMLGAIGLFVTFGAASVAHRAAEVRRTFDRLGALLPDPSQPAPIVHTGPSPFVAAATTAMIAAIITIAPVLALWFVHRSRRPGDSRSRVIGGVCALAGALHAMVFLWGGIADGMTLGDIALLLLSAASVWCGVQAFIGGRSQTSPPSRVYR